MLKKFIYKIDHYYNKDHDEYCLMIESDISKENLAMIIAGIQLKFEELVDESECIDEQHLLEILKKFYGVKDIKKEYARFLPYTCLEPSEWAMFNIFKIIDKDKGTFKIIQIDGYEARENSFYAKYKKQMEELMPADNKGFESEIRNLRDYYPFLEIEEDK
ncbi:hypothetical protein NE686_17390 [Tissierella carlieri]|uniref:Uncharacterized protein n=1 Tax=Tissierella carlieri TaxID=689904 RepID=A0ABT1SEI6_9FIRM|nr:hypothetical protein [Tissierella carlieri]MCQ4924880.1 hypothetical protein [Tissierella carlieri]